MPVSITLTCAAGRLYLAARYTLVVVYYEGRLISWPGYLLTLWTFFDRAVHFARRSILCKRSGYGYWNSEMV